MIMLKRFQRKGAKTQRSQRKNLEIVFRLNRHLCGKRNDHLRIEIIENRSSVGWASFLTPTYYPQAHYVQHLTAN